MEFIVCANISCAFLPLNINLTATLPEITQAPNLFINMPNKYSF